MSVQPPETILCLASYEKGQAFMQECKRRGKRVILLTVTALEGAGWPRDCIDETFYMPELSRVDEVIRAVSYLARSRRIDRVVPLDDYDVETAAALREHFRLPGTGASAARLFRDKLAMRVRTRERGILVPDFVHILNYDAVREYMARVSPPWVLKPRAEVSTIGIARIGSADELWPQLEALGDRQSYHLLERYVPGDVYHADSIVYRGEVVFAEVHRYGRPPLDVFHGGGIAISRTVKRESEDEYALQVLNREVLSALGMENGASHMEFIKGREDGRFYFLEVGARVGGGNTAELIEAATGVNIWAEWAKIVTADDEHPYRPLTPQQDYGAVILSLARQEYPDTSAYTDPEIVSRLNKHHHVGFVLKSHNPERLETLLAEYSRRFYDDFFASLPPWEQRPPSQGPDSSQRGAAVEGP